IAKDLGARVATTVGADDIGYAGKLGADTIIDYTSRKFEDEVHGLDAVFDTVGGDTYVRSFKVLKPGGRLVSMLEQPREDLIKQYGVTAIAQFTRVTTERLARLAELVDRGAVKVRFEQSFPLERAAAALHHLQKDAPKGKVV